MYMTTMEKHQLEDVLKRKYDSGQPELVLNLFGRPEGRAVTKQVYCDMVQTQRYSHSQGISIIVQEFTLAKSLLLSSRAMQPTPPQLDRNAIVFQGLQSFPVDATTG